MNCLIISTNQIDSESAKAHLTRGQYLTHKADCWTHNYISTISLYLSSVRGFTKQEALT